MSENMPPSAHPVPDLPGSPAVDPKQLIDAAMAVITRPREFWPGIAQEGPSLQKPLLFAIAMGVVAGAASAVVSILRLDGIFGVSAGLAGAVSIILYPLFAIIGVYVGGGVIYVLGNVLGARPQFHVAARIAAYGMALMPLYPVASIIPFLPLLVHVYGLYVIGLGMIALFPTDARKTWIVMAVLAALALVMTTSGYLATRAARRSLDSYGDAARRLGEQLDRSGGDFSKAAEELRKAAEQAGRRR